MEQYRCYRKLLERYQILLQLKQRQFENGGRHLVECSFYSRRCCCCTINKALASRWSLKNAATVAGRLFIELWRSSLSRQLTRLSRQKTQKAQHRSKSSSTHYLSWSTMGQSASKRFPARTVKMPSFFAIKKPMKISSGRSEKCRRLLSFTSSLNFSAFPKQLNSEVSR